ncbi:MAG: SPOR domain-containing protein [Calditrichaeota bacterium]|nr:MAG: SPOR domain-containing protein [Calditrichota bacterium]
MVLQFLITLSLAVLFFSCGDSSEKQEGRSPLGIDESRTEVPSLEEEEFVFDEDETELEEDYSAENTLTEETSEEPAYTGENTSKTPTKILENFQDERLYTIQVSSWETKAQAEEHMQKFLSKGFESYIQRAFVSSKNTYWYRVRIGVFQTEQEAKNFADSDLSAMLYNGNYWVDLVRNDTD